MRAFYYTVAQLFSFLNFLFALLAAIPMLLCNWSAEKAMEFRDLGDRS